MLKKIFFISLIINTLLIFSQDSLLWKPTKVIDLAQNYQQIETDPEGNIYLIDSKKNKITKLFIENNYDSVYTIGGMSGRQEGFLHIAQLCSKNRQTIYVLDDAQRRISLLNTNLKVTGGLSFLTAEGEEADIMPTNFEVNGAGELFVLNGLDNKIYKFDNNGKQVLSFGGQDYGDGNLQNPTQIAISDDNKIYVLDTLAGEIKVFDMYGIFLEKIFIKKIMENSKKISLFAKDLIMQDNKAFIVLHLPTLKTISLEIPVLLQHYTDISVNKIGIYLLIDNKIYIYHFSL